MTEPSFAEKIGRDAFAEAFHSGMTRAQMAEHFGCSECTIRRLRREWGISGKATAWTPKDDATLRDMRAKGVRFKDIAAHLGRKIMACRNRANYLGICRQNAGFSPLDRVSQDAFAEAVRNGCSRSQLAERFEISASSVRKLLLRWGLDPVDGSKDRWTPEDDAALRHMLAHGLKQAAIGIAMGRSVDAVSARARRLGLTGGSVASVAPPPQSKPPAALQRLLALAVPVAYALEFGPEAMRGIEPHLAAAMRRSGAPRVAK